MLAAVVGVGIQVTPEDRKSLEAGLNRLKTSIDKLMGNPVLLPGTREATLCY